MSVRNLFAAAAAALLGGVALAAPALADVSVQSVAASDGMTSGRLGPTLTALVGFTAVVIGALALRSAGRIGSWGNGPVVALVTGLISVVVGGLFAVTADGGPGTGNGIVGAFAAVLFGLIGVLLGALALARNRRAGLTAANTNAR
ncbi:DUF6223 family protein [Rhodococcus maanshanensis]|uniref:Tryptophan-associated transmembrane protein (Trp_oprn_chp) n=1 Tax=Rhodococcus maanshanensis TaxID=183556 RepID=A0A1H7UJ55_9NOCA|nr:DUF6223 family protein [Rhodococcus maanshanensis]SEL97053.1 hypothetical protein SAMN05444583_11884 [Rhodococcus maanshanensis]